jgi:predicted ATPase
MTDRFFLTSVALEHFKSVRRSGTVKLTPLTVFIGNNGSGKSSLIEGLETYRTIVLDGLDAAMDRWHGMNHIWNNQASHRRKAASDGHEVYENLPLFQLKGHWGDRAFSVKLELSFEADRAGVWIEREEIKLPTIPSLDEDSSELLIGRSYQRDRAGRCLSYREVNESTHRHRAGLALFSQPPSRHIVLDRETSFLPGESASPQDWKATVRRWQFLALVPEEMGAPTRQRMTGGPPMLNRDGSNLGQYLWSLRDASVDAFNDLLDAVRVVLPYARDVQVAVTQEIERWTYLEMTEQHFKIPGWLLSTGTLRILALLACLRHPDPPPLLVVEEIENGLDPRTIHLLVEELRAAVHAKKTQILVTTHSPYLLDLLDLSHIVVVERVEGEPVFSRPDKDQLRGWSKSFAPGRLYTMGRLTRES